MARVYYVGDWAVLTGPVFAETPFHYSHKGLDIFNYGHWLKSALEATGEHEVASVPTWDFYNKLGPGDYERVLAEHDVLVFSDVDAKLFQLAPSFFDRSRFGAGPLTFPDRIRLTLEAVRAGKGLMLLGGWYSFTGEMGKGGWGRTPLAEALPVRCLEVEDLVESTEGFSPRRHSRGADVLRGPRRRDHAPAPGLQQDRSTPRRHGPSRGRRDGRPAAGRPGLRQGPSPRLHVRPGAALGPELRLLGRLRRVLETLPGPRAGRSAQAPCRAKPSTVQAATTARIASSVRSRLSGVTETRVSRSTTLQSLPGMSSCWYSFPPIQK